MRPGLFLKAGIGCLGLVVVGFVLLLVFIVYRQHAYKTMPDSHDLKQRITKLAERYVNQRTNAALVIGVIQGDKRNVFGFGHVSATTTATPDGETIFEIGSATKVFTAVTLASMVNDGVLKLEDPISQYLPKGVTSPQKDGREITLVHLATHSAGLPRLPDDLVSRAKDPMNPYADYDVKRLYEMLSAVTLKSVPGEKSDYSNLGFGLLGHILTLKANKPYAALVDELVCAPLGLTNTTVTLTPEQQTRLAPGHDPKGAVVPNWDFDVLAPAGALKSSANDMVRFVAANLKTDGTPIGKALAEAQRMHFKQIAGGVGLAWQLREPVEGQKWHWHNGGTGGYVSFIGFEKQTGVGVVLLSNYGDAMAGDNSLDVMGVEILRLAAKISLE